MVRTYVAQVCAAIAMGMAISELSWIKIGIVIAALILYEEAVKRRVRK